MKRNVLKNLIRWKENGTKVPFLLVGTKGTGKTYLAMEFAMAYYPQYLYVNFELNKVATQYFEEHINNGFSISKTIAQYFQFDEVYLSEVIIILDEISFCPALFDSFLRENAATDLSIIAISGILPNEEQKTKFQVSRLFPLGFDEFLSALGSEWYIDIIQGHFQNQKPVPDIVHQELLALFEEYLLVGGMPAAVNEYISSKSIVNINEIHCMLRSRMQTVTITTLDEKTAGKAKQVVDVIPEQLKRENKKFRFNSIRRGVTFALYKDSLSLLEQSGMLLRLNEKNKEGHFKVYLPDVGMLSSAFLGEDTEETRKALLENYVMQTLLATENYELCFWESEAQAKVDFIIQRDGNETPVELRTTMNGKAKSIASYQLRVGKTGEKFYRFGFENFNSTTVMTQIPYYAIFCL